MSTFNTPFPTNSARNAALVSSTGTSMFLVILAALHVVRADLDPSCRFISEYELGPLGWLMHVAFICLAVGAAGVAFAVVSQARSIASYVGTALLLISAAGMTLAGVVAPDSNSGIHDIGAMLDLIPFAALLIAWSLSRNATWASTRVSLWRIALLPMLGLLAFMVSMAVLLPRNGGRPGPSVFVGWQNRFMIVAQCIWLLHTARQVLGSPPTAMIDCESHSSGSAWTAPLNRGQEVEDGRSRRNEEGCECESDRSRTDQPNRYGDRPVSRAGPRAGASGS
ncbi:DUF998 domain-containing protein [Methylocystis bryophila]|uniref:DUF998 domain-containing protein n=1 Tax=Methylocystis bryophila TaxID=655015 RepID=A0A1W6MW35_9HYPH|nr:DUF998 domain-containing protein [Methylocystis bryophila]ARN81820.1 hypothetical protein B1812_12850 [Methylocystis bryophila]BDV37891.1 hypothetical protein DSM21852_11440 [Methylocystis bryophila]